MEHPHPAAAILLEADILPHPAAAILLEADILPHPAPAILLEPDILPIVMGIIPASRSQVAWLRVLRLVCKDFKEAVDNCRRNRKWTGQFAAQAADFRGDVARTGNVCPPFSLNRGIERMLLEKKLQSLIQGMKEYNSDCTTQEIIITRLLLFLSHWCVHRGAPCCDIIRRKQTDLHAYGAHGLVAWAMRTHPNSRTVQKQGCRLLSLIVQEKCERHVTPYIVGTLAAVMHANMQDLEVLRTCVEALYKMLRGVVDLSDAEDASDDGPMSDVESGSSDGDVMNMSALMHTGVHNVPNLLIRAMREHMDDYDFQRDASDLFELFTRIMGQLNNRTCMEDFVMHEAEAVLIASMHRHSHQTTDTDTDTDFNVQGNCIMALQGLMNFDFESMVHTREAMQATINAAVQYSDDFMEHMFNMFETIMQELATSPLETERMQTFAANSGMVQMYIMYIFKCRDRGVCTEDDIHSGFQMLIFICKGNPSTSAQMVQADVVRTIDSASFAPKSARYHSTRDYLVEMLET